MTPSHSNPEQPSPQARVASGEMARLVAEFDWSATSLGPSEAWSASLRAAVRLILASPSPLVMLWGREGFMLYNDAYAVFAGSRHPFLLGQPVEAGWPEVADFNRNVVDTCLAGGSLTYTDKHLVLYREGHAEDVWLDLSYSPVADDGGQPAGVIAIVFETTAKMLAEKHRRIAEEDLRRLTQTLEQRVADEVSARVAIEDRLRQSHKLEALGSLTGGVAHDFNNVLQVISSNLQLMELTSHGNETLRRRLSAANEAVARGAKLAAQLLAVARRQPLSPKVVKPARVVNAMEEMLRRTLPETIELKIASDLEGWNVCVDQNQLEIALLNLVVNSRDAIRGSGVIRVSVECIDAQRDERASSSGVPTGEYVRTSVLDTGAGMAEHVKSRAMEPFFTTKAHGQGTGLGLSMAFGFVSQSEGHMHLESKEGQGTRIDLYFPRSRLPEHEEGQPRACRPVLGGETVLVVEDDAEVRTAAVDMLTQLGYHVMSASDGDSALTVLQSGERIDLLFTDVVMPGKLTSRELATIASEPPFNIPVLFASGYTRDIVFHHGKLDEGVKLISKPYRLDGLAQAVRDALGTGDRFVD